MSASTRDGKQGSRTNVDVVAVHRRHMVCTPMGYVRSGLIQGTVSSACLFARTL